MRRLSWHRGLIPAVLLLWLPACSSLFEPEPPVADSTMVNVLIEFHLAGARVEQGDTLSTALRDSILTAYGLDSTGYAHAMAFYVRKPDAYLALYSQVLDRLNAEHIPLPGSDSTLVPPPPLEPSSE